MTQERLAELADLNIRTLQKIEAGQINILITTMLRLQRALRCRWACLLPAEDVRRADTPSDDSKRAQGQPQRPLRR